MDKYLFNRKISRCLFFGAISISKFDNNCLTFTDWSRIVPVTIVAFDRRDANPCIAMRTVKPYRTSMSEVIFRSPAMSWSGELFTWCYGVQREQSDQPLMGICCFVFVYLFCLTLMPFFFFNGACKL